MRAVPSLRTPCGGDHFKHAQRQLRGFVLNPVSRQRGVLTAFPRLLKKIQSPETVCARCAIAQKAMQRS